MNITRSVLFLAAAVCVLTGCRLTPTQTLPDFGNVLVGTTSPAGNATWTNSTSDTYAILAWERLVTPFSAVIPDATVELAPRAAVTVSDVRFAPTMVGPAEGRVRPLTRPRSSPAATFRGRGVAYIIDGAGLATIGVTPATAPLDLGRRLINAAPPASITFTITNDTASPMNLTGRIVSGAPVFGVRNASIVVPARDESTMPPTPGSAVVTLTFAPIRVGQQYGTVEFTGVNLRLGVLLMGTGVADESD
jgi:hypothetical protein